MPGTVSYLNHEPVSVLFGAAIGSLTNLGFCAEGDITVTVPTEWVPQMTHQTGAATVEAYYKGGTPTIDVTFSEINNWDLWETVFMAAEKQRDTATPPNTRVAGLEIAKSLAGNYIGHKATSVAKFLVLRPVQLYVSAVAETARDWVFPKSFCSNVAAIPFGVDTPNAFTATFTALFDSAIVDGANQWTRGLKTALSGAWVAA